MQMPSSKDTKCSIISIEAAHDISPSPPFTLKNLKNPEWERNNLLRYGGPDCSNKLSEAKPNDQVFSEIGFCKYIFKNSFVNRQPVGGNPNNVTEEEWEEINKGKHLVDYTQIFRLSDPLTQSRTGEMQLQDVKVVPDNGPDETFELANFNIMTRAFPRTGNSSAAWGRKLMDIFVHKDYVFLVLDTGDDLIKTIRDLQLYTAPRDPTGTHQTIGDTNAGARLHSLDSDRNYNDIPNIYQIHSPITLADSGCKGKPDSKNYETRNSKGVRLFSYFDLHDFDLRSGTNDPAFPTSFDVNTQLNTAKLGWNVQQDWTFPNGAPQVTKDNPHKQNNNRNVKAEIQDAFAQGSNVDIAFAATRKRSGDQGAISYAKKFPEIVTTVTRNEQIIYVRGPQEGSFGGINLSDDHQSNQAADAWAQEQAVGQGPAEILRKKKQWYKERTYFLTGDWPAWEWSTMNKTNAIIIYRANGFKYAIRSNCI
jgi:hypothetical protein